MSTKAALKAAKSALDHNNLDQAIEQAQSVLAIEPENYFARLFLGRALEKKDVLEDAAKTYSVAAKSKPDDSQAWLGLCSVYEKQDTLKVDEYRESALKAAEIIGAANDLHRSQTIIDKLADFTRKHGSREQMKKVLMTMLPDTQLYTLLEGRLPHPSHTYTRIAEIVEAEENQRIKHEIDNRRTRIGARVGQVTSEVKREVFAKSIFEHMCRDVINWSIDDDVRRQYEEKLLERAYAVLEVLPMEQKSQKLDQVLTLAEGMAIIHHPFQLAWDLVLESRDLDDLRGLDLHFLTDYITFFPWTGTAKVLRAWLSSEISPFPVSASTAETGKSDTQIKKRLSPADCLLLVTEGISDAGDSAFAYRLASDYYLHLEEHSSAAESARVGLRALDMQSQKLGMTLQNTKDALNSILATALVHHQAPRHHAEARMLFEGILERKHKFTSALVGLGLIYEEMMDFNEAVDYLSRALEQDQHSVHIGTELAWCRAQSGNYQQALEELEGYLSSIKAEDPRTRDLRAQTLFRIGVCLWESNPSKTSRRDRNGSYARFLAAIKTNVNFAPAYTSLGFYYQECARDNKRARQCFQKAFELSPAEVVAAEHLAKAFADQGDWDIVEVVAQRVVDSGRARPPPGSKKKGLSWPYSALGVVQMNRQDYQKAIVSFLAALRIRPDDYQSYVGLGESYHNSGRYNSALRTFKHALEPRSDIEMKIDGETWFATYMLANVHRELGDYDQAIADLQAILEDHPFELGVLISLLQTLVERSWKCIETGVFGQAAQDAKDALKIAFRVAEQNSTSFNLWKAVGDACSVFWWVRSSEIEFPADDASSLLATSASKGNNEPFPEIDGVAKDMLVEGQSQRKLSTTRLAMSTVAGILSYKRAIASCADDVHAQAVAWYNLGWAEHHAHVCSDAKAGKKYLKCAVRCFKRAIELEAGNADFWNALGVVTTPLNPKVAQHAFVRSLHLNELNTKVWANLGVLFLLQNDVELAHHAFVRSQSTDPDYAHAWVGEGLVELLGGRANEAFQHFTHAFEIADSASMITKRQYALSSFDHLTSTSSASGHLAGLIQPAFALYQLRVQVPCDLSYGHLAALVLERLGDYANATKTLEHLCTSAEAEYEACETLSALARFAMAKSDLARSQFASQNFRDAIENAEIALDLSSDTESSGLNAESRRKLRLSSHLTAGLAYCRLHAKQDSINMFKLALVESGHDVEIVYPLVQVLWSYGGSEEKLVARDQLFGCVEQHPEHVDAVVLLGVMTALENDEEVSAAIRSDLMLLRTKKGLKITKMNEIEHLLSALAGLRQHAFDVSGIEDMAIAAAQASVMRRPDDPNAWSELVSVSGDSAAAAAPMALHTALASVPPTGNLPLTKLANAFAGVGSVSDAQRAVFLEPWNACNWQAVIQNL